MDNVFSECVKCGKELKYGSAYVSINRNVEQPEYILATNSVSVTVLHGEEIASLCGDCGNAFDGEALLKIIKALPAPNSNSN